MCTKMSHKAWLRTCKIMHLSMIGRPKVFDCILVRPEGYTHAVKLSNTKRMSNYLQNNISTYRKTYNCFKNKTFNQSHLIVAIRDLEPHILTSLNIKQSDVIIFIS